MSTAAIVHNRLLLVEDSDTQAMQLQHFLEGKGYEVRRASSAEAALELMSREVPDLVLTDLNLPGMSGGELCRRLRMVLNTRAVPVLLLTTEEGAGVEAGALEGGADDFVRKSDGHPMLLLRVQALLRRAQAGAVLAGAGARLGSASVLVVEDSATYRKLLIAALEADGYGLRVAETGEQALACLAEESFDAMVLDLVLPDMSGLELCRRMAQARRAAESPVMILALSGQEDRQEMNALLEGGADDVLGKSRDMGIIRTRLRALVRRKLLFDENRRIAEDLRARERALLAERADRQLAQARAALVGDLERANRELRETQAQLVQSAKMASLGQLVAGIAHEINNPTAFVMAHVATVEALLEKLAGVALPTPAKKDLEKARLRLADSRQGLDRVRDLVLKLRTFSRLDEGEFKVASVRDNVEAVLTMLRHRTKHRIRIDCALGEPDRIGCYPALLNQALLNVLSNAIDAIEGEGVIAIRSRADGEAYEIRVTDSGKGIPASAKDRVFEPFFTTKPVGQGTGLGMSITWQIVQRHGGTVAVESEDGRGTSVAIRLPLERGEKT